MTSDAAVGSYNMQGACDLIVSLVDFIAPDPTLVLLQSKRKKMRKDVLTDQSNEEILNNLLQVSLDCYKALHPLKKEKKHFLNMLLRITDPDHRHLCW